METNHAMTFHDPYDEFPIIDVSTFFTESPTLICSPELPFTFPDPEPNDIMDPDDPLLDPVIWALCNGTEDDDESRDPGHSGFPIQSKCEGINGISFTEDVHPPMPVSMFSVPISPQYNCSCCQRLRVITHTKGMNVKRLEIHGSLGIITHAILENSGSDSDSDFECKEFQMFDFHKESTQSVKLFIVQYLKDCEEEGYNMEQDPLSIFYQALSIGLEDNHNSHNFLQENTGRGQSNNNEKLRDQQVGTDNVGCTKIPLAVQRARTGKLKVKELIEYFEFPMEVAARKMNICPTVMKKICRRNGLYRWPYRKIRSFKNKIEKKSKILESSNNEEEKTRLTTDIQRHQQELINIYDKFSREDPF